DCRATLRPNAVNVRRMPRKSEVDIIEQSLSGHKRFAITEFFGRTTIIAHRSGDPVLLHVVPESDRSRQRARTQQIMPAAMPIASFLDRLLLGHFSVLA